MPAGTAPALAFTKNRTGGGGGGTSLGLTSHPMPSTALPGLAFETGDASRGALGIGTSSEPGSPGYGAGRSRPRDESGANGSEVPEEEAQMAPPTAATRRSTGFRRTQPQL